MKDFVHLSRFERTLFSGAEWPVKAPLWLVLQLNRGVAYVRAGTTNNELPAGASIVVPPNSQVTVLASVLAEANLRGMAIKVSSLSGLLTLGERLCLEKQAAQECAPFRQLTADHPLGLRVGALFQAENELALPARLGVLQGFAEWVTPFLNKAGGNKDSAEPNPKRRLEQFINEKPESELVDLALGDVAKYLCCCERHASRLFHEVCGCSFRKYVSELRLRRACHLLAQGDYKIIDVALESGHSSLALFNYNFKNRFRMTPTEWRLRNATGASRSPGVRSSSARPANNTLSNVRAVERAALQSAMA
jgi:AraC-like DNA-binding protein